jgi:N4-gp56 family major capsid protein
MKAFKNKIYFILNLRHFDVTNATTSNTPGNDLSPEMKTYYSKYLFAIASPQLVHDQFGQKQNIPRNGGKTIEFRKKNPLPKALTPLTEGITPTGQPLNWGYITSTVQQYGGWVPLTDILLLTAIDNNMVYATEDLADQAGRTLDTVTREVINGGTSVQYAESTKTHRYALTQAADKLTVECIRQAVRFLKTQLSKPINGDFVAIIHPDVSYDLMKDEEWKEWSKYTTPEHMFNNEIGKIAGVRFVETTEAKIFHAEDLTEGARELTVKTAITTATDTILVKELISTADAAALVGRKILIGNNQYEIQSATTAAAGSATIKLTTTLTVTADTVIYPGEAGAEGVDVYSTLILGKDAYGITEIEGGGLEHIYKPLGSGGTSDPLNQRATAGWKAIKTAERLVETFMVRVETCSTYESGAN